MTYALDLTGAIIAYEQGQLDQEHNTTVFHEFDYGTQEAVIYADTGMVPIEEYVRKNPVDTTAHTANTAG